MVTIREGSAADVVRVNAYYESRCRSRGAKPDHFLLVGESDDNEIVGVVLLQQEHNYLVLRGMDIQKDYRRRGLGTRMLRDLEMHMRGQDCYCLPFAHLRTFYEQVRFKEVSDIELPDLLRDRLREHQKEMGDPEIQRLMQDDLGVHPPDGLSFIAMKRSKD
jgi:N-acetylglutamate synthase-like GNAT family acetyltransferase